MPRGRPEIDPDRCKGCCLCVSVCPERILGLAQGFNRQGQHYAECLDEARCTACTFCAVICPDTAIRVWRHAKEKA